jgi:hypothetical protein
MSQVPRVTVHGSGADVLGQDDEGPAAPRRARLLSLGLAVLVGFGAGQLVPPLDDVSDAGDGAPLALVTGRQPFLDAVGEPPVPSLEVTLVNTGPEAVRLLGAGIAGTALRWEADRPLEVGQQATAVLREEGACDRDPDLLSRQLPAPRVVVQMRERPEQGVTLDPVVALQYDDHVRNVCNLPRLPQALEVLQGAVVTTDDAVTVAFGLLSRSVRPLRVVGVTPVPGLAVAVTDAAGRPVDLPLTVLGRTRQEIAVLDDTGDPASTPYRARISAQAGDCQEARAAVVGSGPPLRVVYEGQEQGDATAEQPLFADLLDYLRRLCG